MDVEHPSYWLVYVSNPTIPLSELTAIAPEILDRPRLSREARVVLAEADACHDARRHDRVVFAGDVTHWLRESDGLTWADLDVDLDAAFAHLDQHSPALLVDTSPIVLAGANTTQGTALRHAWINGTTCRRTRAGELRRDVAAALELDWPPYIRSVMQSLGR